MTTSDLDLAAALARAICQRVGEPRYNLWFNRRTKLTWNDDLLTIGVPNLHFQEWLQKTFGEAVRAAAADVFGAPMRVRFTIEPTLFQAARQEQDAVTQTVAEVQATPQPVVLPEPPPVPTPKARKKRDESPTLFDDPAPTAAPTKVPASAPASQRGTRRWRRLGDFVIGPGTRVAHASALSVIEDPGLAGNPLVFHGPTGTGKTHLLEGIYVGLRRAQPTWRVCYVTAEDFTNRFVQAMRLGKLGAFRKTFREVDALLVDDLHFLASKKATQEEFLHTFDALQAEGRVLVFSCDCHPRLAEDFSPELTDRLLGGAVWGLAPPDTETRLAILRSGAVVGGPPIPEAVLALLASRLRGNVRELEGALHSLRHYAKVTKRPVDRSVAEEALGDLLRHAVRVVQIADIDAAVCRVLQLEGGVLKSKGRAWAVSHPRMLAMYLARKHTASAYSEIGTYFGGRNHSTVVAAEKKVRQWVQSNEELTLGERSVRVRDVIERVERELLR